MRMKAMVVVAVLCGMVFLSHAEPKVSISGFLDADVWGDLQGNYFTNSEIDLGMGLEFTDKVSAHFFATVWSAYAPSGGGVPARSGLPEERWLGVTFDGLDITFESSLGTFVVGDIVYQFGKFNYYFYKRLSMIAPESFTRGAKYSLTAGPLTQEILAGVSDINTSTVDIVGSTTIAPVEGHSIGFSYGMRGDGMLDFESGFSIFGGAQYTGSFGEILSAKVDVGYLNTAGAVRKNAITVLAEPVVTLGKFSTALTGYVLIDPDSINDWTAINAPGSAAGPLYGVGDELLLYAEPGLRFTDKVSFGLPLEYHGGDLESDLDDAAWIVPTLYVYPAEPVQWWIWGSMAQSLSDPDVDPAYGVGSEIIVTF